MQQTHAVFGELAHYSFDPFILFPAVGVRVYQTPSLKWQLQNAQGYKLDVFAMKLIIASLIVHD